MHLRLGRGQPLRGECYVKKSQTEGHADDELGGWTMQVKWYRGVDEFYRFVPAEEPQATVFSLNGVEVDVSLSLFFFFFFYYKELI